MSNPADTLARRGFAAVAGLPVVRPTLNDRKIQQAGVVTAHDLLTDALLDDLGTEPSQLGELGELLHLVDQRGGHLRLDQFGDARGQLLKIRNAERHAHPRVATEGVDRDGNVRALDVFKEEGMSATPAMDRVGRGGWIVARGGHFAHAVRDGGDFQNGVNRSTDALELPLLVEVIMKASKIGKRHRRCLLLV